VSQEPLSPSPALTVADAAALAGVSVKTIRRAIDRGALRAVRPAGCRRIVVLEPDVIAWRDAPVVPRTRAVDHSSRASRRAPERGSLAALRAMERSTG
jgi:excisionase family DNA binding protein